MLQFIKAHLETRTISDQVHAYVPIRFGMVEMWIDIYNWYKGESVESRNWMRLAGSERNEMGIKMCACRGMDLQHVLTYHERFSKIVRAATFSAFDYDTLKEEMRRYNYGSGQFHHSTEHYGADPPPYSEMVAHKDTPQPPTTEQTPAASASSSASPVVGVTDDSLVTASIAAEATVGATTGAAQPGIIMENLGGIGPELQPQIGLDLNILTLAGRKIFKDIRKVSSGIGQGIVILDLPIDPWSATVLNTFAYAWAILHEVFYGGLNIHIQIVTSATIMGTIKFAFVPRVYSDDFVIEQANMDALNAIELACNVNREGTIRCIPTTDEYARTGVFRRSTLKNFGRLIGITATSLYNAYQADVEIQVKVACSLMEGSKYVVPSLLKNNVPLHAGSADLDLAAEDGIAFLSSDGQHHDGVDYGIAKTGISGKSRLEVLEGTTIMEVASYPKMTTFKKNAAPSGFVGEMYPIAGHEAVGFPGQNVLALYEAKRMSPDTGAEFSDTKKVDSFHWLQWMNTRMQGTHLIRMTDVQLMPSTSGGSIGLTNSQGVFDYTEPFGVYTEKTGGYVIDSYDPHVTDIDNHGHFYLGTFRSFRVAQFDAFHTNVIVKEKSMNIAKWLPDLNCVATQIQIGGIPIATTTAQIGGIVPARFWNCKVADVDSVVPSVTKNQFAHSMIPSRQHQKAVSYAVAACESRNMKSVVTTLTDASGVVVAEVLRNRQGMYIRRQGLPRYARCVQTISTLRQEHQFTNLEFPQIRPSAGSEFPSRVIGPTITATIGNKTTTMVTPSDVLKDLGQEEIIETAKISRRYGADPPPCATAAKAAAIMQGGNAITGMISGVFRHWQ